MLHANLSTLLRSRLGPNVDVSEDPEYGRPEDEEDPVPEEGPVGFEERDAVDDRGDGAEGADDDGEDPFPIRIAAFFACVVEVDGVQADDCEREHELEEAQYHTQQGAHEAAGGRVVADSREERHFGWGCSCWLGVCGARLATESLIKCMELPRCTYTVAGRYSLRQSDVESILNYELELVADMFAPNVCQTQMTREGLLRKGKRGPADQNVRGRTKETQLFSGSGLRNAKYAPEYIPQAGRVHHARATAPATRAYVSVKCVWVNVSPLMREQSSMDPGACFRACNKRRQ